MHVIFSPQTPRSTFRAKSSDLRQKFLSST